VPGPHAVTVQNPGPVNSNSVTFTVLGTVTINEYLADPPTGPTGDANGDGTTDSAQDEFIEIINRTNVAVNVGGYTISDTDAVRFTFPANTMIPANEAAVIFGGGTPTGEFGNAHANGLVFTSALSLNNTGDTITLKDSLTNIVESITYGSTEGNADQSINRNPDVTGTSFAPHSTIAGAGGRLFSPGTHVDGSFFTTPNPTITSISPNGTVVGSGDVPITVMGSHFQAASQVRVDGVMVTTMFQSATVLNATVPTSVTSSPGAHAVTVENSGPVTSNSVSFTVLAGLGINEYLADPPAGAAGDANGDGTTDSSQDEFVEVINRTNAPVNVGGFTISDADSVRFTFPPATMIPAGEVAVIFGGGTPTGDFGNAHANGLVFTSVLSLNNGGDTITLKDSLTNTVESITFGSAEGNADQSINRNPDVTGISFAPHSTIAGSGGRLFSPGTRVDGSFFTAPNPTITSISPDAAIVGSGDIIITVTGSHYQAASQVRVDGSPIATTFQSATSLSATVPASITSAAGTHAITVQNPGPINSNSVTFRVLATLGINEYLADPPAGAAGDANGDGTTDSSQDEFVEVINRTNAPVNVGGYTISDADSVRFTFPANTMIPAGEVAVIFGGGTPTGDFGNAHANGLVFTSTLSLNNTGDTITLKDSLSTTVESITFGSTEGNADQSITRSPDITGGFVTHTTAAGSGGRLFSPGTRVDGGFFTAANPVIASISPNSAIVGSGDIVITVTGSHYQADSLVRVDGSPIATMFQSTTSLSATIPAFITSTPGAHAITVENPGPIVSNPVTFTVLATLGINEYLADPPTGPAGDANGDGSTDSSQDEFVEVINRTNAPVNVGGYTISDATSVRFTFPANTMIPAGEVAVVFGGGTPTGDFGNAHANGLVFTAVLSLNNGGDTITLKDSLTNPIEEIIFGSTEGNADQSINRNPDVTGTTFAPHSTVPGSGGRLFSPGTRVDGTALTTGPRITVIQPNSMPLGVPAFDVSVHGSGFEATSLVFIDSLPVMTTFVSASELTTHVPESVTMAGGPHALQVRNEGGNRSNTVVLTIIPPPPLVNAIVPRVVPVGVGSFSLFVMGENFFSGAVVLIDGTPAATTFQNGHELRATITAALVSTIGSHRVKVRGFDGQESNEVLFEVIAPLLRVNSISPAQAIAGSPGFTLTVTGANFKTGDSKVTFDNTVLATTFVSATQLRADVPASLITSPGARAVAVQASDGTASNQVVFQVLPNAPLVRAVDPPSTIEGAGGLTVTLLGERFQRGAVVRVIENQLPGARLDTTFISSERLEARVPAGFLQTAGAVLLVVFNPDFGVSNAIALNVFIKDPLVINEYLADPPGAAATDLNGDANGDGSRSSSNDEFVEIVNRTANAIDISGYKISDADEVRHVFAAGTIVPPFEAVVVFGGGNPTGAFGNAAEDHLVFKASTGSLSLNNTGTETIRLTDAQGRIVQEINFGSAEGGANQSINRTPDIDGATFARHTVVAGNSSRLFSPGTRVDGGTFTIKPAIRTLAPATVRAASPSFTLTVSGSNFLPGAEVIFGQTTLATVYRSDTLLEAQVSGVLVAIGGVIDVRVRNPKGETSSIAKFIVAEDPPRIARLSPEKTGTGAENLEVTITGERFQQGAKATIGTQAVETRFVSSTSLVAIVPTTLLRSAGTLTLRVTNADGNQSNTVTLTVENGPLMTRLAPKKLRVGSGTVEITVGGVAFQSSVVLFVNDVAVPTTFVSETSFTARIPAAMTGQAGSLSLQARHADGGRSNRVTLKVK
jgi:hypothetical protein